MRAQIYTVFYFIFRNVEKFFLTEYDIQIWEFESGSIEFLKELYVRGQCQVSIFSDAENYRRIEMFPKEFDPMLNQVNLLLTQYLTNSEVGKTIR